MKNATFLLLSMLLWGFPAAGYAESPEQYRKASDYLSRKGEVYFTFQVADRKQLDSITKYVSIDNVKGTTVFAYANKREFARFRELAVDYKVLPHPGEPAEAPKMYDYKKGGGKAWDAYPTYDGYVALMQQFATDHPDLCRIVDAGTTPGGRKLLFAVVSDNVAVDEPEPRVMYTSTMHGDETAGYVMLLHLIDSLLTGYSQNTVIRSLVNSTSVWICPLANPDGTYAGGNGSVSGATRYNANSIDINRNFPNPVGGDHPDGAAWQPETNSMMTLASAQQFTMAINFHGGAELVNYPWDSWTSAVNRSADDAFWQRISRDYVDTVHAHSAAGYMDEQNNGITNGGDWYIVYGSRQDYMGYYRGCREVTIEISDTKLVPASTLMDYWNYNHRSLFNYIRQATFGLTGRVTDQSSGNPLRAKVTIVGHDRDNSEVYSTALFGDYYRPIQAGSFSVEVRASGYIPRVFPVTTQYYQTTALDAALAPNKVTDKIALNGTLLNASGTPVGSPVPVTYDVTVRLHGHPANPDLRYTETFLTANSQGITIDKGNFRVVLGSGTTANDLRGVLQANNNLWVEITIDGDALSRVPLTASPLVLSR